MFTGLQGTGACTDPYPERVLQRMHAMKSVFRVIPGDIENQL